MVYISVACGCGDDSPHDLQTNGRGVPGTGKVERGDHRAFDDMDKLVPFKLDPVFSANRNSSVPCADCGRVLEFRHARITMVDISENRINQAKKEVSLDELARNIVWTFLCPECWQKHHYTEPEPEKVQ